MENDNFLNPEFYTEDNNIPDDLKGTPENMRNYYMNNNLQANNSFLENYLKIPENKPQSQEIEQKPIPDKSDILSILSKWNEKKNSASIPYKSEEVKTKSLKIPKNEITNEINNLGISQSDKDYLLTTASLESGFNPYIRNTDEPENTAYGLYQFVKKTLISLGLTKEEFNDTRKQHSAALRLKELNLNSLNKYMNKTIRGITFTPNKLAAAAHLAGAQGFIDWANDKTGYSDDKSGTTIEKRVQYF